MLGNLGKDDQLYRSLSKAIFLAAGVFVLLWFIDVTISVMLTFALGIVLTIALNPPVYWLEKRGIPRAAGATLVVLATLALGVLIAWIVVPRIISEGSALFQDLPEFSRSLQDQANRWLSQYPDVQKQIGEQGVTLQTVLPNMQQAMLRVGRYTISLVGVIFFLVILLTIVLFALASPRDLVKGALGVMPGHLRDGMERALVKGSRGVVAWVWSNIVIGAIEAVLLTIFLQLIGVPGAVVWGTLGFFAELVPQIGIYIIAVPVLLVALAQSPETALWTLLFLIVLNQVTGNFIAPAIRGRTMELHPVSQLFLVLALGSAFGFLGAVLAMPIAGFVKALYQEFYVERQEPLEHPEQSAERVLRRELPEDAHDEPDT